MLFGPGTRLGPYEIVSAIGAGGMGDVYRATDTMLVRKVAIEVFTADDNGCSILRSHLAETAQSKASAGSRAAGNRSGGAP